MRSRPRAARGARVFTSSADVYGPWHGEPVDETAKPPQTAPYAVAKLEAERRLSPAARWPDRPAPRDRLRAGRGRARAIPAFIRAFLDGEEPVLHRGGTDVRDYVHVEDVAAAIVNACLRRTEVPTINVGSGAGRSTRDVLDAVAPVMGVEMRPAPSRRAALVEAGLRLGPGAA